MKALMWWCVDGCGCDVTAVPRLSTNKTNKINLASRLQASLVCHE